MGATASMKGNPKINMVRLFKAIEGKEYIVASQLLLYDGTNINCTNFQGETPLIAICRKTKEEETQLERFVKFLTANGANVKRMDPQGWTASMHARDNGYDDIAAFLEKLERKASCLNRNRHTKFAFLRKLSTGLNSQCNCENRPNLKLKDQ